jgi:hypothetical protein
MQELASTSTMDSSRRRKEENKDLKAPESSSNPIYKKFPRYQPPIIHIKKRKEKEIKHF